MFEPYQRIFFDFDSTLICEESLDLLGDRCGVGEEVRMLTEKSMNGEIPFAEIFGKKIDLIAPTRTDVEVIITECRNLFVPDTEEVIKILHELGKEVFILSSNFTCLIEPLVRDLGITKEKILANELFFDENGNYAGMTYDSPLCASGAGKGELLRANKNGLRTVMVGDSVSDMACQGIADLFIGFGGVVTRERVKKEAQAFAIGPSLKTIFPFILIEAELEKIK